MTIYELYIKLCTGARVWFCMAGVVESSAACHLMSVVCSHILASRFPLASNTYIKMDICAIYTYVIYAYMEGILVYLPRCLTALQIMNFLLKI